MVVRPGVSLAGLLDAIDCLAAVERHEGARHALANLVLSSLN